MTLNKETSTVTADPISVYVESCAALKTVNYEALQRRPCLCLKPAWLLCFSHIRIKKIYLSFLEKYFGNPPRETPTYKTPVFCLRQWIHTPP